MSLTRDVSECSRAWASRGARKSHRVTRRTRDGRHAHDNAHSCSIVNGRQTHKRRKSVIRLEIRRFHAATGQPGHRRGVRIALFVWPRTRSTLTRGSRQPGSGTHRVTAGSLCLHSEPERCVHARRRRMQHRSKRARRRGAHCIVYTLTAHAHKSQRVSRRVLVGKVLSGQCHVAAHPASRSPRSGAGRTRSRRQS